MLELNKLLRKSCGIFAVFHFGNGPVLWYLRRKLTCRRALGGIMLLGAQRAKNFLVVPLEKTRLLSVRRVRHSSSPSYAQSLWKIWNWVFFQVWVTVKIFSHSHIYIRVHTFILGSLWTQQSNLYVYVLATVLY